MKRLGAMMLPVLLLLTLGVAQAQQGNPPDPAVENGSAVKFEYVMKDDAGEVLTSTQGKPFTYVHGRGQILPGLEKAMEGMRAGETKQVTVPPEDGFGPVDPAAEVEVPKEQIPPDALTVGAQLLATTGTGNTVPVKVKEIREATVVLDLNHPLAGKTLRFDVEVIEVEPPTAK